MASHTTKRRPVEADFEPVFRLSLEDKHGGIIVDQTDAILLRRITETSSITAAARSVGISYRNAWDRIKAIETRLGEHIVQTKVGGATGGGATLTPSGAVLLNDFRKVRKFLFNALEDRDFMSHAGYKLSARNRLKGRITKIEKGVVTASVKMVVQVPTVVTSIISLEAVDDLALKEGDEVEAIIKSTEVIIGKET